MTQFHIMEKQLIQILTRLQSILDLTSPDFFMWSYLKSEVNAAHLPLHPRTESPKYGAE